MYSIKETTEFLNKDEQKCFSKHLEELGLDESVWAVFETLFRSGVKGTKPIVIKVYDGDRLEGAAFFIKTTHYGRALFKNIVLSGIINRLGIPVYLWIRLGCCMDMMSNPGFSRDPGNIEKIHAEIINYLRKNKILTIITDYDHNHSLYSGASILPALPHALIKTTSYQDIQDYIGEHKNIKKKLRKFEKTGGHFGIIEGKVSEKEVNGIRKCFLSTAQKSVFYLPYQDLYLEVAINTSRTNLPRVYYFVAYMEGEFLGYQAAIHTGDHLNALHGAFDRTRNTTHHAYDILFVKMTDFAVDNRIKSVDFGAVLNITKQRMVNKTIPMSYYLYSKFRLIGSFFNIFLKMTNIQGKHQMKFR